MRHDKLSNEELEARKELDLELLDLPDAIAHMENGGQVYRYGGKDRFFYKIEGGVLMCRCNELGGWRLPVVSLREGDELYVATVDWHSRVVSAHEWTTLLPLPNHNTPKQEKEAVNAEEPLCSDNLLNRIAAAIAHRACCGTEQDLANGKLHGYCVVCGVPWPCETASAFLVKPKL